MLSNDLRFVTFLVPVISNINFAVKPKRTSIIEQKRLLKHQPSTQCLSSSRLPGGQSERSWERGCLSTSNLISHLYIWMRNLKICLHQRCYGLRGISCSRLSVSGDDRKSRRATMGVWVPGVTGGQLYFVIINV